MQCIYREMCSPGKALVEDHMEEEGARLYRGQEVKTLEEEHKTIKENRD